MSHLNERVIIVTGASSGIGEAIALFLAEKGATLVLVARRLERINALVDKITKTNGRAIAIKADVTKLSEVKNVVSTAISKFNRVDVLINNAGYMAIAPLSALKTEEWEQMIDTNIKGVLNGIAAVLPVFENQKAGHFINVASVAGIKVLSPGGAVYSATKFAVRALSEGLRYEAGSHIRTTIISPGAVESELLHGSSDPASKAFLSEFYQQAIPAQAIAKAVAYAIEQPEDVDVNEIVIRPTREEY
ncbi:SDR family oxidoreductase [Citrobacter amalonaticus]|uniref:SDR family oxidoreductase n=1 Tax=Citrobacter amalonaticus TaxID=35703 RepID=UPI00300CBE34